MLLEKAWAKIFGSYYRIESGSVGEALPVLTSAPTINYLHSDYEKNQNKFWKILNQADELGYIITTAVQGVSSTNKDQEKHGLVDEHAYSIIAALEVEISKNLNERFVYIRNPWGFREWHGEWSDKSIMWMEYPDALPNIKKALHNRKERLKVINNEISCLNEDSITNLEEDDGCFWMCFDDFFQYFSITAICHYNQNWKYSYTQCRHEYFPKKPLRAVEPTPIINSVIQY